MENDLAGRHCGCQPSLVLRTSPLEQRIGNLLACGKLVHAQGVLEQSQEVDAMLEPCKAAEQRLSRGTEGGSCGWLEAELITKCDQRCAIAQRVSIAAVA